MQTQPARFRHRGYRESRALVALAKSIPADVKDLLDAQLANEAAYEGALPPQVALVNDERVAEIQHYRAQLAHRLLNRS